MNALELRRALHLVADGAIMADDAIVREDADGLRGAVEVMTAHMATIRAHVGATDDATDDA